MWKDNLWKKWGEKIPSQGLWKEQSLSTLGCGKKTPPRLEKKRVFHINFPYCSCYYKIYERYIYLFILFKERKFSHALYL